MVEQFIPFVSEVGFPIVVTLYLLYRIEAKPGYGRTIHSKSPRTNKGIIVSQGVRFLDSTRLIGNFMGLILLLKMR